MIDRMLAGLTGAEMRSALIELCRRGLVTCTQGEPGEEGSTYAVAWLPLDNPDRYSQAVRQHHRRNMERFAWLRSGAPQLH